MNIKPNQTIYAKYFSIPFSTLIERFPHLASLLISVKPHKFDLGDPNILSTVNKYLFKAVLNLDISVPQNFLIPSLGIRHAYCDSIAQRITNNLPILEIGTGASAAIALILAKKYQNDVIATEISNTSTRAAKKNITFNNLSDKIKLLQSRGEIIEKLVPLGKYSALVSYPPVYERELTKLEKKRGWKGTESELIGGEKDGMDFTKQLVSEAFQTPGVEINLVSVMLMNIEQIKEIITIIPTKASIEIIQIIAGTRKRYIIIISKK